MKIKTIQEKDPKAFDIEVNAAIKDGWTLANRGVITTDRVWAYFAELVQVEKPAVPELMPWQAAVLAMSDTCNAAKECNHKGCPMYDWCEKNLPDELPPGDWSLPGEEAQA